MIDEKLLTEYARLVVNTGVNIADGQDMIVSSPIECAEFARYVAAAAYDAGARDVTISWSDERFTRLRYEKADAAVFNEFPAWRRSLYSDAAADGAAFVSIYSTDPDLLNGIPGEKLRNAERSAGAALLEYRAKLMNNENRWCVVSAPSAAWACKVFPDLSMEQALDKLWRAILSTVRVSEGKDAVKEWDKHIDFLHRAAAFMNKSSFSALHYRNGLGTDLVVGLPEGHIWAGGSEKAADGRMFAANIPSEEIYTVPDRMHVDGKVEASKPLVYNGSTIEGFGFVFKDGRVVDFHADKGRDVLDGLLKMDDGSMRLGEAALVPYDSPISKSGVLFYNTLFDENAACHLALGKAYPTCLKDGAEMDSVTLLKHGVNDSLIHEDFMIGTADLKIDGIYKDGRTVPVFRDGNFTENALAEAPVFRHGEEAPAPLILKQLNI